MDRAPHTGPKSGNINRLRPLFARIHRWNDEMSVLPESDVRKAMSDKLNIRVATDLTDRQNSIRREETSGGRQAYFHNGRLLHRKEIPRHSLRSSSETGSHHNHTADDAPHYPERTKQTEGTEHYRTKPLLYSLPLLPSLPPPLLSSLITPLPYSPPLLFSLTPLLHSPPLLSSLTLLSYSHTPLPYSPPLTLLHYSNPLLPSLTLLPYSPPLLPYLTLLPYSPTLLRVPDAAQTGDRGRNPRQTRLPGSS